MENLPQVTINRSKSSEAVAYLFTTRQIYNSFYKFNNFYVLPYKFPKSSVIYYPRYWKKIDNIWKQSNQFFDEILQNKDQGVSEISKQIKYELKIDDEFVARFKENFKLCWNLLMKIVPELLCEVESIELYPTSVGSICSEYSSFLKGKKIVRIFCREDCTVKEIYKMILIERIYKLKRHLKYTWSERMVLSEFIVNDTSFNKILKEEERTLNEVRKIDKNRLFSDSIGYLKEMGFLTTNEFNLRQGKLYIEDNQVLLPRSENKLLMAFIENNDEILEYEDLAKYIWGDNWVNKFSLEAITQIVKRTRKDLKNLGVNSNLIQSVRGKGYILVKE